MRIQIRARDGPVTGLLRAHVERRLGFALGRFGERVDRVTVRFSKTDHAVECHIGVGLRPDGNIAADDAGIDRFVAVNGAADRASRSVARALARERDANGGRPAPIGRGNS